MKNKEDESTEKQVEESLELIKKINAAIPKGTERLVVIYTFCFLLGNIISEVITVKAEEDLYLRVINDKIRHAIKLLKN